MLIAAQLVGGLITTTLAAPDVEDRATSGQIELGLTAGPLLTDVRCRLDDRDDGPYETTPSTSRSNAPAANAACQLETWRATPSRPVRRTAVCLAGQDEPVDGAQVKGAARATGRNLAPRVGLGAGHAARPWSATPDRPGCGSIASRGTVPDPVARRRSDLASTTGPGRRHAAALAVTAELRIGDGTKGIEALRSDS